MEPLTVLILAGGRSTRMGQDKAWLELAGAPLVEHVARRLLPLAAEIIFSTNQPLEFDELIARLPVPARAVPDEHPGVGPLAGLHAGLKASNTDLVLAVATDMPFVEPRLVELMAAHCRAADAVIPRLNAAHFDIPQPEPLHALYRRRCLPAIEAALRANVCYLDEDALREVDPELKSFRNANTREEWAQAEEDMRKSGAGGGETQT
jgi:molybdopterin-guanine dinucleotide biosynthesis protein A